MLLAGLGSGEAEPCRPADSLMALRLRLPMLRARSKSPRSCQVTDGARRMSFRLCMELALICRLVLLRLPACIGNISKHSKNQKIACLFLRSTIWRASTDRQDCSAERLLAYISAKGLARKRLLMSHQHVCRAALAGFKLPSQRRRLSLTPL